MGQKEHSATSLGNSLARRDAWSIGVGGVMATLGFLAVAADIFVSGHVRTTHVTIVAHASSTLPAEYLAAIAI